MRIAIFTDAYDPYISGVTTSIKMLKTALENMHHEVLIITANLKNNRFIYDENKKIIYIPGIKTGIYETRLTGIYSRKAMKIIKEWKPNIIHSQTEFGIGVFSRIVARKLKIPVVHTYHTLYEDYVYYVTHGIFDNLGKKLAISITKYFCDKKCDELIVPTDKIKNLFMDKYHIKRNIHVIPSGIDTDKFIRNDKMNKEIQKLKKKYKIKEHDFVIGSIGRVAKEKSLDVLLKNASLLIKENKNFKVIIVGNGPDLDNLKELVKKLNIKDNVIFTGSVSYDLVPIYYHLFSVMVSFSKSETQGLTIIEALASSIPTICIDDKSFREMIEDQYNGYLITSNEQFIERIYQLKNNLQLYSDMAINAKNSVHKYSKEVFAADVLKVYAKALKNKY